MFRMTVDFGNLADAGDRFEEAYQQSVREMKATLDAKAAAERATHAYKNRTGDLEASTYASEVISIGDADEVQFGARAPYARYVSVRGLMRVDELAAEADSELAFLFAGLAKTI